MKNKAILFFCVVFIVCLSQWVYFLKRPLLTNQTAFVLTVEKGMAAKALLARLRSQLPSPTLFRLLLSLSPQSNRLQAGTYSIEPGINPMDFLAKLSSGDVIKENVVFVDGLTVSDIIKRLDDAPFLNKGARLTKRFAEYLKRGDEHIEGLLLADTYQYEANSDALDLLKRSHEKLVTLLNDIWQHRNPNLPYKEPYELLIAASIIEKEASHPLERRLVSAVIVNRLNRRMPLQMDPTIIYALGPDFKERLLKKHLSIKSPYNTYKRKGLPPTPIAIVGFDALDAAAHPAHVDYLYFVAKGDGYHHFSRTIDEQNRAIARYRKNKG